MIIKEDFIELISALEKQTKKDEKLYKLGIDSTELNTDLWSATETLIEATFGKEDAEWIFWYCFERNFGKREDLKATRKDEDGVEHEICRTVEELYDLINEKN